MRLPRGWMDLVISPASWAAMDCSHSAEARRKVAEVLISMVSRAVLASAMREARDGAVIV